jgi:hypothetical protein
MTFSHVNETTSKKLVHIFVLLLLVLSTSLALSSLSFPQQAGACVSNAGESCSSSSNSCGMVNTGGITCGGGCSATTPPNSACGTNVIPPTLSLTASPNPVPYGDQSKLTWSSANASNCVPPTPNGISGTAFLGTGLTNPLTTTSTFTFSCTGTVMPGSVRPEPPQYSSVVVLVNVSPNTCVAGWSAGQEEYDGPVGGAAPWCNSNAVGECEPVPTGQLGGHEASSKGNVAACCYAGNPATELGYMRYCGCVADSGTTCTSAPNSCGQTTTGTYNCNGVCSATPPSNSSCPIGCSATTINNCTLPATGSGNSAGSCTSGTSGTCSFKCTNGTWGLNSNGCVVPAPTAKLTASPNPVAYGGRATLTWGSTNAKTCTAEGPWSNNGTLSGSGLTNDLTSATTFSFYCTGAGGQSPLVSVTVNVGAPPSCTNGANNPPTCNSCTSPDVWNGSACVAPISVTAKPVSPITLPTTAFTEHYTLTGGTSSNTTCELLNYQGSAITGYTSCSGAINSNTPATVGTYGYYVQAYQASTHQTAKSNEFTVMVNAASACSNGANNPPTCNSCTSPDVWNGSACVAPISVTAKPVSPITLPTTAFTEHYTLTGGTSSNTTCELLNYQGSAITGYTSCSGAINSNTPATVGTYGYYVQAYQASTHQTAKSNEFTVMVNPATTPSGCSATTINNCSLPATGSGYTPGFCVSGTSGTCDYTCSNGTWTAPSSNKCVPPCTNGANNPSVCNTCNSPQIYNGSECITPTCSVHTANPTNIDLGQSTKLTWTCNTPICTQVANGDGFSTGPSHSPSGSDTVTPSSSDVPTANYAMVCGPSSGGGTTFDFPPITVNVPSATITGSPTRLPDTGGTSTITWSCTDMSSCIASGPGLSQTESSNPNGGSGSVNITTTSTYTVTGTPALGGSQVTSSVTVNVEGQFTEF